MLYPILLEPVFKEYLWGGNRLKGKYNKISSLGNISESWELSTHDEGVCGIANGRYAGRLFTEYLKDAGPKVLGKNVRGSDLPVLVKLIDTADRLSVQVHPGDEYARAQGSPQGKTEFWYVMDCEDGAELYFGIKDGVERGEFVERAQDGTIVKILNSVRVKPGDAFLVPPGTVHAIGPNMTVAEIGTNCNITYRIHDYGRRDVNGNLRELHIDKAADVYIPGAPDCRWIDNRINCGPFTETLMYIDGIVDITPNEDSFQCVICLSGQLNIDKAITMTPGCSAFIPAGLPYTMKGEATVLITTV